MAVGMLIIVAAALGTYGYFRGAIRFFLAVLPLILASLLLWLLGPLFYRFEALRNAGLAWPGLMLLVFGSVAGYAVRFVAKRKLPRKIHRADRIGGSIIGVLVSVVVVWLGCVYATMWSAARQDGGGGGSAARLAHTIDSVALQWIPVVGSGSTTMMGLLEISTADEEVRRQALHELGFDRLFDVAQIRSVMEDAETRKDVEAAARGNVAALWRLQRNPKVLQLVDSEEVREAVDKLSLDEIVEAVRRSKSPATP